MEFVNCDQNELNPPAAASTSEVNEGEDR
jgi:hypothetical protein